MKSYHSFLIAFPECAADINAIRTPHWHLSTQADPSQRFWISERGVFTNLKRAEFGHGIVRQGAPCVEILIHATDQSTAYNVQQLIFGGVLLGYPDLTRMFPPASPLALGDIENTFLMNLPFSDYFQHSDIAIFGCQVAVAAWDNQQRIYAIEKLKLSWRLDWFTPHSASPRYGQIFDNIHPEFTYHTEAAFAIIAAFSAIEELGLEVRSSLQKPRFTGSGKDEWNPEVRTCLETRLRNAGIDFSERFDWLHRGDPTHVEVEMKPKLGSAAAYSDSSLVRDREIDLVDAIHYASWLRNKVAAHRFSELTESISPYDVYNLQSLARQLILAQMSLWRK